MFVELYFILDALLIGMLILAVYYANKVKGNLDRSIVYADKMKVNYDKSIEYAAKLHDLYALILSDEVAKEQQ